MSNNFFLVREKAEKQPPYSSVALLSAFFMFFLCISFTSASSFGYDSTVDNSNPFGYDTNVVTGSGAVNYSTVNVNNSQYLQGLTPTQVASLYVENDPYYFSNPSHYKNSSTNPFDQSLNTTDDVTFNSIGANMITAGSGGLTINNGDLTSNGYSWLNGGFTSIGESVIYLADSSFSFAQKLFFKDLNFNNIGSLTTDGTDIIFNTTENGQNGYLVGRFKGDGSQLTNIKTNLSNVAYTNQSNSFNGVQTFNNTLNVTNGYIMGQPLTGMLGSGLIQSVQNSGSRSSDVNVTCSGLVCKYNNFTVRIMQGNALAPATYCSIPNGTLNVPDNTNAMYYVDSNCAIQQTTYDTWFTTTMSNGGTWDFTNILSHSGSTEVIDSISLEQRRLMKARILNYYEWQGKVLQGFNFQASPTWRQFNITSGKYVYGMDVVSTNLHTINNTDTIELVGHQTGSVWNYTDQNGLNITTCDTGTTLTPCTGNNWRRHFIFNVGYDTSVGLTTSKSEMHQLYPLESITYSSVANCLDTITYPLTYTLPQEYTGSAVMLYAYCAKRTDTSWTTGQLIDLRTVKTGTSSSGGTDISGLVPYSGANNNLNLAGYNLTASYIIGDGSQLSNVNATTYNSTYATWAYNQSSPYTKWFYNMTTPVTQWMYNQTSPYTKWFYNMTSPAESYINSIITNYYNKSQVDNLIKNPAGNSSNLQFNLDGNFWGSDRARIMFANYSSGGGGNGGESEIIHYKMNDNTGTTNVIDSSPNGYDGTLTVNSDVVSTGGKINSAFDMGQGGTPDSCQGGNVGDTCYGSVNNAWCAVWSGGTASDCDTNTGSQCSMPSGDNTDCLPISSDCSTWSGNSGTCTNMGCSFDGSHDCGSYGDSGTCTSHYGCSWGGGSAGTQYVSVSGSNPQTDLQGNFSIFEWVNFNTGFSQWWADAIACKDDGTNKWILGTNGNGLVWHIQPNGVQLNSDYMGLSQGNWYHLGITKEGNNYTFWKDGTAYGSATTSYSIPTQTTDMWIGKCEGYLNAKFDDFRLYNYSLTPTQIATLYNSGSGTEDAINYSGGGTTTSENDTLLLNYTIVARSYNVQTEVFKSNKSALSFIKNSSDLLLDGKPNDKAFTYSYEKLDNWVITGYNTTTTKSCKLGIFNCKTITTTTPIKENKPIDTVNLAKEIALQKQQIYDLSSELCRVEKNKYNFCTSDGKVLK